MREVYDYLADNGQRILREANRGDELSKRVIATYRMHRNAPHDPGAAGILQALIEEHQQREKANG